MDKEETEKFANRLHARAKELELEGDVYKNLGSHLPAVAKYGAAMALNETATVLLKGLLEDLSG